jgi:hypothetical protein
VGDHGIHALIVDVTPREASESNNQLARTITVRRRPEPSGPEGAIPGFDVILILAAVAAISALGTSRRLSRERDSRWPKS